MVEGGKGPRPAARRSALRGPVASCPPVLVSKAPQILLEAGSGGEIRGRFKTLHCMTQMHYSCCSAYGRARQYIRCSAAPDGSSCRELPSWRDIRPGTPYGRSDNPQGVPGTPCTP